MSEPRIIKRYANRKLYDTQHSRYVTLEQIAEMIRLGDDVTIIDNKTKEDLTSVTLAQIIFEEEKKQKSFLPLQAMRNIIQSGGETVTHFVTEAKGKVTRILPRKGAMEGGEEGEEVLLEEIEESPGQETADGEGEGIKARRGDGLTTLREFRDWVIHSQKTIDEWQKKVDGRIRHVVEGMSPFGMLQKEVHALASRIAELEAKLVEVARREAAAQAGEAEDPGVSAPASSGKTETPGDSASG